MEASMTRARSHTRRIRRTGAGEKVTIGLVGVFVMAMLALDLYFL